MTERILYAAPIDRPRLYAAAEQARVILFVGLAGSGKTVASNGYLQRVGRPSLTIDLRTADDQGWPVIQRALATAGLPAAHPAAAIAGMTAPTVFVIDGLEIALRPDGAPKAAIGEWLRILLAHPLIQTILVSRRLPDIPDLALLAASAAVHLVDGQMLAFTPAEVQSLWRRRRGTGIDLAQVEQLVARSGGLAALVALACTAGIVGSETELPLQDVLIGHMLNNLPADLRALLTDVSLLESLTPMSITALTARSDGARILRDLRQYSLVSSDRPAVLHPLMREALQEQLRARHQHFLEVARRAIDMALDAGEYQRAWCLALDAQLWDIARTIIHKVGQRLRQQGSSHTLIQWISALPSDERDNEMVILLARAQSDIGDLDGAVITIETHRLTETDPIKQREYTIWLANIILARGDAGQADSYIQPYLDDVTLAPSWRPHVARIHAMALASSGREEEALVFSQRAIAESQAIQDIRMLAFSYQEHGIIALRLGRYALAEQFLRLAERCWHELDNSPEMAVTLNAQAMIAMAQQDFPLARDRAASARVHALAGSRLREAALASATSGDVALAQGHYDEALLHYQVAEEDASQSAAYNYLAYSLALQGHVARLMANAELAYRVLQRLRDIRHRPAISVEDRGWVASGMVAAQLALGEPSSIEDLEQVIELLGTFKAEVLGVVMLMLAQAHWVNGRHTQALACWWELESMMAQGRGGHQSQLAPLAAAVPELLHAALSERTAPFARFASMHVSSAPALAPDSSEVVLEVRLCGEELVRWHGQPVALPKHGIALLSVLLTVVTPLEDAELLRMLWGEGVVAEYALKKLIVRVRAALPGLIKRSNGHYMLSIPREAIDFDLGRFLSLDIPSAPTAVLLQSVETIVASGIAAGGAPWAILLQSQINRRLTMVWLEIARRAGADGASTQAGEAFERAQLIDPASDMVARAAMQYALHVSDRPLAIRCYLRYQQALDEQFGVEPARDLEQIYRQALEP
jgi:ATP/maltotriose-dependent transcriptional regulator MalT/DNA-binding SARP family transcriptional activator